jgi:uncharacterized LabA/DUF88 family protein
MKRTIFLIDGFNLYHSIRDIYQYHKKLKVKWLDIYSFCSSLLYQVGRDAKLDSIYYFTAYAYHLKDPSIIRRHKNYVKCLKSTGVIPEIARFKPKDVVCRICKQHYIKHEEKETDVAICAKLMELLIQDECDVIVIITGDTDLAPAVKTAKTLFSEKNILFAFPFRRTNDELLKIAPKSFTVDVNSYIRHQFPDPFVTTKGEKIDKPVEW